MQRSDTCWTQETGSAVKLFSHTVKPALHYRCSQNTNWESVHDCRVLYHCKYAGLSYRLYKAKWCHTIHACFYIIDARSVGFWQVYLFKLNTLVAVKCWNQVFLWSLLGLMWQEATAQGGTVAFRMKGIAFVKMCMDFSDISIIMQAARIQGAAPSGNFVIMGLKRALFPHSRPTFGGINYGVLQETCGPPAIWGGGGGGGGGGRVSRTSATPPPPLEHGPAGGNSQ